jgi:hypothetical protein
MILGRCLSYYLHCLADVKASVAVDFPGYCPASMIIVIDAGYKQCF